MSSELSTPLYQVVKIIDCKQGAIRAVRFNGKMLLSILFILKVGLGQWLTFV